MSDKNAAGLYGDIEWSEEDNGNQHIAGPGTAQETDRTRLRTSRHSQFNDDMREAGTSPNLSPRWQKHRRRTSVSPAPVLLRQPCLAVPRHAPPRPPRHAMPRQADHTPGCTAPGSATQWQRMRSCAVQWCPQGGTVPVGRGRGARHQERARPARPGRRRLRRGSGIISPDNDDGSAENLWRLHEEAGLPRTCALPWNIMPWYVGSAQKIRALSRTTTSRRCPASARCSRTPRVADRGDVRGQAPQGLVPLLLRDDAPLLPTLAVPHPSPQSLNVHRQNRHVIVRALRRVVTTVQYRCRSVGDRSARPRGRCRPHPSLCVQVPSNRRSRGGGTPSGREAQPPWCAHASSRRITRQMSVTAESAATDYQ